MAMQRHHHHCLPLVFLFRIICQDSYNQQMSILGYTSRLSYLSCGYNNMNNKTNFRKKAFFYWLTVLWYRQLWQGIHGHRSIRPLVTMQPQLEAERDECLWASHFFLFIQSRILTHGKELPTPPQATQSRKSHTDMSEVCLLGDPICHQGNHQCQASQPSLLTKLRIKEERQSITLFNLESLNLWGNFIFGKLSENKHKIIGIWGSMSSYLVLQICIDLSIMSYTF